MPDRNFPMVPEDRKLFISMGCMCLIDNLPGVRGIFQKIFHRSTLVLILILFILLPAHINGDFEHRADYDTGDGPHAAALADLDGDGDLDIVTADYYGDNVSVLMNDGEGIFTKEEQYQTGDGPRSIFLADIDDDDDIDIVTGNYVDDTVSVLKNNGDGTFAPRVDHDTGSGPFSIFLADVGEDANSDLDLITADEQEQGFKVSVLENDGTGAFGNRKSYKVGTKPKGLFLADLDDDGYHDIATANWADDTVSVLINKGDGTFENDVVYDTGDAPRSIYIANVDGDNFPDIVTADQYSNNISLLLNNGDGTFGTFNEHGVGANSISIFLGDIDGDGDNDILTSNLLDNTISVLKNDGSGGFSERVDYEVDQGPYSVLLGDVNGDGEVDIVTANNYADSVSVRYSNFPPSITIFEPDGVNDLASTSYTVTWQDYDPYEDATIFLYWDDDDEGLDGTQIVPGLSEDEDGTGGSYIWNTSDMPAGEYWVYALIAVEAFEPRYDYSPGVLTINTPPTFQIVEPDGNSDFANEEFTIMWTDSDPDDDASISLFYDTDDFGFDGELIVEGLGEDADGGSGIYNWNTTDIPDGEYYIHGRCDDGINEPVERYSSYPVIVDHTPPVNDLPFIQIMEPDGEGDDANTEYMISWIDSDADNDASISLYYDSDAAGFDGTLITSGVSEDEHGNSGVYIWNTSQIPEGEYWIHASIADEVAQALNYSSGPITIDHSSTSNEPPSFQIIEPDGQGDFANKEFTIMWIDSDPDDDATISLYYDTDNSGFDGVPIISGLSEDADGNSGIYNWYTTDIPEGEYHIYGICDDGNNEAVKRYSNFPVTVNHTADYFPDPTSSNNPSMIWIIEPDGENDRANTEYMITWIDSDADDDASISLYYNSNPTDLGGILIASGLSEDEHGNSGLYIWNTTQIPGGDYFVYAIIDDGIETSIDFSPGVITIDHSGIYNAVPRIMVLTPEKGYVVADDDFTIKWSDSDPDDDALVSLYYDTNQNGYDGILIVSGLSEDDEGDSFLWDTSNIPNGDYYIYGMINDSVNKAMYDYSDGKLRINHSSDGGENGDGDKPDVGDTGQFSPLGYPLVLVLVLVLILIIFLLKKPKEVEGEEEQGDFEEKELPPPPEDLEEGIEEELLPPPEDYHKEPPPPPDDFEKVK